MSPMCNSLPVNYTIRPLADYVASSRSWPRERQRVASGWSSHLRRKTRCRDFRARSSVVYTVRDELSSLSEKDNASSRHRSERRERRKRKSVVPYFNYSSSSGGTKWRLGAEGGGGELSPAVYQLELPLMPLNSRA